MTANFSSCFSSVANFHVNVEQKDVRVIDILASERQNCLLHLLSLEFRVL